MSVLECTLHVDFVYVVYFTACPEGFVQYDDKCLYYRDYPHYDEFLGNPYARAESFCQSISHVGVTAHVVYPWSLQSNFFVAYLSHW